MLAAGNPVTYKTNVGIKVAGKNLGFEIGDKLNVFQKEGILLFTKLEVFPGWAFIKKGQVFRSGRHPQFQLVQAWVKYYMEGLTHFKMFYTNKGIFIKAFKGDEFDEMFKKD
jgi:hypothetical protein